LEIIYALLFISVINSSWKVYVKLMTIGSPIVCGC